MALPSPNDCFGQTLALVREATTETMGNINQEKSSWLKY